jgi:hypothetical protein
MEAAFFLGNSPWKPHGWEVPGAKTVVYCSSKPQLFDWFNDPHRLKQTNGDSESFTECVANVKVPAFLLLPTTTTTTCRSPPRSVITKAEF